MMATVFSTIDISIREGRDSHINSRSSSSKSDNKSDTKSNVNIIDNDSDQFMNNLYIIPDGYDYDRSTEDNYMIETSPSSPSSSSSLFVGKFARERSEIDYTYHKYYSNRRQLLHDHLMERFLQTTIRDANDDEIICDRPVNPWLVFTAGCMGAGKGHTIQWLAQRDLFPLKAFVEVDPDKLRELLPEFKEYNRRNSDTAGYLTQKEVGYLSEVLTLDALHEGKNVLVDGSLRDAEWYSKYIKDLRMQFPHLNIGILYVTANKDTILARASERAKVTGRIVPEDVILTTLRKLPESIRILSPLVDFLATFENEEKEPRLVYTCKHDDNNLVENTEDGEICQIYNGFDDWKDHFQHQFVMECPMDFHLKKKQKQINDHNNEHNNNNEHIDFQAANTVTEEL